MPLPAILALALLAPWWDDYPYTTQSHDPAIVLQVGGNSALTGAVDDPTWGIEAARIRGRWLAPQVAPLRDRGVRILTWVETFGTTHAYVAAFRKSPGGGVVGHEGDPGLALPVLNHWSWQNYRPADDTVVRWLGLDSYFDDDPAARPWTRTHPRYGCVPMTYPDGTIATGRTDPSRPDTARIYDAGGSKDVLGGLDIDYGFNAKVAEAGVTDHLIAVPGPQGVRYSGQFSVGKDSACPVWIDYAKASARQLADFGVQGLWADNYSAWDSLGSAPVQRAFGDWSVHRFRTHLGARMAMEDPDQDLIVADPATFDIRTYLRARVRALGGDDTNLRDPRWRDPSWLDDPLWLSYLAFKQSLGREALRQFHEVFHQAAQEAGIDDFAIQGNDIPIYSLGMPQPDFLEMVSTEFSPGWNLFSGPRGLGLPPDGRIAPVIRTARVHAKSRFVQVWYYLDGDYADRRGDDALFKRIAWEMLANNATIQCHPGNPRVAGSVAAHAEVSAFINQQREIWGDRVPWAKIAVVYSADRQLAELTPGGMVDFAAQRHVFDLLGWGTWLAERHLPYDVLTEHDLQANIKAYDVVLLPTVTSLHDGWGVGTLRRWVEAGGTLILSGDCGARREPLAVAGLARHRAPAGAGPNLSALAGIDPKLHRPAKLDRHVGSGRVIWIPARGFDYYQIKPGERDPAALDDTADWFAPGGLFAAELPRTIEAVPHVSPARDLLFVDLASLGDEPVEGLTLRLIAPGQPAQTAELRRPGREPIAVPVQAGNGTVTIGPFGVADYASVVIPGWKQSWLGR